MLYKVVVALSIISMAAQRPVDPTDMHLDSAFPQFMKFMVDFRNGVPYSSAAETLGRFTAFKANLQLIRERNAKGQETHGITKFADLTREEFKAQYLTLRPPTAHALRSMKQLDHLVQANYTAASTDWCAKGACTPVKNQGQCGSCWAFSATEQLESQYYQTYGKLMELSPQQLTSCDPNCAGCSGGNPINAWIYVNSFGGQESESKYPYVSGVTKQTGSCSSKIADVTEAVGADVGYFIAQRPAQESNMLKQIGQSPMSIAVDAELWQTYTGGIIGPNSGCGTTIDHAVQLTGYNAEGNYWIVRNSWGSNWGESGFVYLTYGDNVCGITSQATITVPEVVGKLDL